MKASHTLSVVVIISAFALLYRLPLDSSGQDQMWPSPSTSAEEHPDYGVPALSTSPLQSREAVEGAWTPFSILPPDHELGLSGDGLLFVRAADDGEGVAARSIEVRGWSGVLPSENWEDYEVVAVVIDGVPLRVTNAARPSVIEVRPTREHLIEVVDLAKRPVSHARMAECPRENSGRNVGHVHPGVVSPDQWVVVETGSPLWFMAPESGGALYWVTAPGMNFKAIPFDASRPSFERISLQPGGSLELAIVSPIDMHGLEAVVLCSDGLRITTGALSTSVFTLEGLDPGVASVSLVARSDAHGPPHDHKGAVITAGETSTVQLSVDMGRAADRGHLSGTIRLPNLSPPLLGETDLVLAVTQLSRQDGSQVVAPAMRRIPISAMATTARLDTRVWELGEVDPGGYLLEVQPIGFALDTWVEISQRRTVEIEPPELIKHRVQFTDEATGSPIELMVPEVIRQSRSQGRSVRLSTSSQVQSESGTLTICGVAGHVLVQVVSPTHGTFWHPLDIEDTPRPEVVRVSRGTWIDLTFVADIKTSTAGARWHGKVTAWSGGIELDLRWYESWVVNGNTSKVSLCVPGTGAVELRFAPDASSATIPALAVPAAEPDPAAPDNWKRRSAMVPTS